MGKLKYVGLLYFVLIGVCGAGQTSDVGNWLIYVGNSKVTTKLNWHHEVQYRSYNLYQDLQQMIGRTGIGYDLSDHNNNVMLGYAFIYSENYKPGVNLKLAAREHRLWQQFITKQQFNRVNILHRYRLEERYFTTKALLRMRYFLSLNIPLNTTKMEKKTVYTSGYTEVFINGQQAYFDRFRFYGALGYVFNNHLKMELGYMSQHTESARRGQFQLALFNNFSFLKP
jgi:Protein of unknown function (DUF2490)